MSWIKKYWISSFIIASIVFLIIVHILFSIYPKNQWLQAKWSAGDLLTYVGTVALGVIALWQNQQLQKENERLQNRDSGISLLSHRLEVFKGVKERRYDDVFWDATVLFTPEISDLFLEAGNYRHRLDELDTDLKEYLSMFQEEAPEDYQLYLSAVQYEENDPEYVYRYTDAHSYTKRDELQNAIKHYNYRELITERKNAQNKWTLKNNELFWKMRKEIDLSLNDPVKYQDILSEWK